MEKYEEIEKSIIKNYRKSIWSKFIKGIKEFEMVQEGDKIAICMSGGKDSSLLAKCMQELKKHRKMNFELVFLVMNPGYNEVNKQKVISNAELLNIPITMFETDIFDRVANVDEHPCYLCARMRRGYLYRKAQELGCNKIALGHHFDDVIETILMGMLYGAQMQTMMPKLHSTHHKGMQLIRPLYYVKEADIIKWKERNNLEFIQCACRFTEHLTVCGNSDGNSKRAEVKELINQLRSVYNKVDMNIYNSTKNVNLNTLISYIKEGKVHHFMDDYDEKEERCKFSKLTSKKNMKKYYFTSESVTEGHPDKLADLISDSILDECLKQDKESRVAIETFVTGNTVTIAGQITSTARIKISEIVRETIKNVGYDNEKTDIDYRTCKIQAEITKQSPDIALGVDTGGAGDQGIMFGYACLDTKEYMPYAISMAHKLSKKLTEARKENEIPYLRPDGKTQVTVEYEDDIPKRIETILISSQHQENVTQEQLKKDIIEKVIKKVIPENMIDENTKIYINPTGRFVIGGPLGDTGLTGRKIIVDTYGGYSRHGGGCFSGKDASKVDRSAAYMLRHIAKNLVANGYAKKCEIQVSYAIGMEEPLSIYVNTFRTSKMSEEELVELIKEKFDLTPKGIIKYLRLKEPIYTKTTNYGHFGKDNLPWEKILKL